MKRMMFLCRIKSRTLYSNTNISSSQRESRVIQSQILRRRAALYRKLVIKMSDKHNRGHSLAVHCPSIITICKQMINNICLRLITHKEQYHIIICISIQTSSTKYSNCIVLGHHSSLCLLTYLITKECLVQ